MEPRAAAKYKLVTSKTPIPMLAAANVQIFGQALDAFAFTVDGAVGG